MTARLRLFLAILVLALAPLLAPAGALSAVPQRAISADGAGCDHPCDGMDHSHGTPAACSCAAAQVVLPPVAVAGTVAPVFVALGRHLPADTFRISTRWPPPLRPPRA